MKNLENEIKKIISDCYTKLLLELDEIIDTDCLQLSIELNYDDGIERFTCSLK